MAIRGHLVKGAREFLGSSEKYSGSSAGYLTVKTEVTSPTFASDSVSMPQKVSL